MKPFDLQAALAGDLVVLRNGGTALVGAYNPNSIERCCLIGWVGVGNVVSWNQNGEFGACEHPYNIVGMAPKKQTRTGWVNVYPDEYLASGLHLTKERADMAAVWLNRIACVQVTYEWEE